MSTFPDGLFQYGGTPVGDVLSYSMGNVYYVVQSTHAAYADVMEEKQGIYNNDGTWRVHTTIQSALDAATTNRNDYIIVLPDSTDYDLTAALTITKSRIHLLAPSGIDGGGFPNNSVRVEQTTASTGLITVTGDCVEIGGFFFKFAQDSDGIVLSGTRWHPIVHNNFFGMKASSSGTSTYALGGTGAISHFSIYKNYFTNYNPVAMTSTDNAIAAFINIASSSSTRGVIRDNILHTGANTTVGAAILCAGYGCFIIGNYIFEDLAFGAAEAGTLTLGISNSTDCFVADNRIGIVTAGNAVAGGTAESSYCHNFEATSGGTAAT